MKKQTLLWLIILLISFVIKISNAQTELSKADQITFNQTVENFYKSCQAQPRDDRAIASYYEEDAIMITPTQTPIQGRVKIQESLSNIPANSEVKLQLLELDEQCNMAFTRGIVTFNLISSSNQPTIWCSNYLVIWRKQNDGSWKISREMLTPAYCQ